MSKRTEDLFQKVYEAKNSQEQAAAYAEWADSYDQAMAESGYVSPPQLAAMLADYCPPTEAAVLDVGCGTGLSGVALKAVGFAEVDGADISDAMLAEAAKKSLYRKLTVVDLMKGIPEPEDSYDGAFSTGTFTLGHVGPEAIPEVIRVLKPGGVFCLTVSDQSWDDQGYAAKLTSLAEGRFEVAADEMHDHVVSHNMQAHFLALRKLG